MRHDWYQNAAGEWFGSCIKNDKMSPDMCVSAGRQCDHGIRLLEDCPACDLRIYEMQQYEAETSSMAILRNYIRYMMNTR